MDMVVTAAGALSLVAIANGILERQRWAQRVFGHNTIAAALFLAYVEGRRWLSAIELADLAEVSEDTARRQLAKLVQVGRVEERKIDRVKRYRLTHKIARRAAELALKGIVP
jgi:predicted transcriptional regulator